MSQVGHALRAFVEAARGALEWHIEGGEAALEVPEAYRAPRLGQQPRRPAPARPRRAPGYSKNVMSAPGLPSSSA